MFGIWFASCYNIHGHFFVPKDMLEHACLKLRPVYKMGIFRLDLVWFNVVQILRGMERKGF